MSDDFVRQNSADADKKLDAEKVQVQGLDVFRLRMQMADYSLLLDDAGSGVTYVGMAVPGSATSSAVWKIKKITITGADLSVMWADSNTNFDNVWDDRLGLTYGL